MHTHINIPSWVTRMGRHKSIFHPFSFWNTRDIRFSGGVISRALYSERAQEEKARKRTRFTIYLVTVSPDLLPVTSINQRYRRFPSALITIMIPARNPDKDPNTDAAAPGTEMFTIRLSLGTSGYYQVVIFSTKSLGHSPRPLPSSPSPVTLFHLVRTASHRA